MNRVASATGIIVLAVAFDQALKFWVESNMGYQERIELLPFFALFRTHNEGIAFSLLWGVGPWVLVSISLAVIAFVLWLWRSNPPDR